MLVLNLSPLSLHIEVCDLLGWILGVDRNLLHTQTGSTIITAVNKCSSCCT